MLIQKSKNENLANKLWNLGVGNFTFTTSLGEVTINTNSNKERSGGISKISNVELNGKELITFEDFSGSEVFPDILPAERTETIYSEDKKYEITILVSKKNPDDIVNIINSYKIIIDESEVSISTPRNFRVSYDGEPKDNEFILYKSIRGIETIGYDLMNNNIIIPVQTNLKSDKISIPSDKNVVEELKKLQNKINNLNSLISSIKYLDNLKDFNIDFQFENKRINMDNLEKHVNDIKNIVNIYREYSNIFSKLENQPIFREIEEKVDLLIENKQEKTKKKYLNYTPKI